MTKLDSRLLIGLLLCWLATAPSAEVGHLRNGQSHALSLTAPAGRWATRLELRSNRADKRFDSNGKRLALGDALNAAPLDAQLIPALQLFGSGASLGTTQLDVTTQVERLEFTLGYGVNDWLTLGTITTYGRSRTRVKLGITPGTVGVNPLFDNTQNPGPTNLPFLPVGGGGLPTDPTTVQQLLSAPENGYGYKPVGSTEVNSGGDLVLGAVFKLQESSVHQWVLGLGYRISLADEDDPDNLFDVPLDDGSNDWVIDLNYLHQWTGGFDLRVSVTRTLQQSDRVTLRVPQAGQLLAVAASRQKVRRNLGDFWEYDLEMGYAIGNWRPSITWHRYIKSGDTYHDAGGSRLSALEKDSSQRADQLRVALSWSGLDAWQRGVLALPLILRLEYQTTFDGRNMPDLDDLYFTATAFF